MDSESLYISSSSTTHLPVGASPFRRVRDRIKEQKATAATTSTTSASFQPDFGSSDAVSQQVASLSRVNSDLRWVMALSAPKRMSKRKYDLDPTPPINLCFDGNDEAENTGSMSVLDQMSTNSVSNQLRYDNSMLSLRLLDILDESKEQTFHVGESENSHIHYGNGIGAVDTSIYQQQQQLHVDHSALNDVTIGESALESLSATTATTTAAKPSLPPHLLPPPPLPLPLPLPLRPRFRNTGPNYSHDYAHESFEFTHDLQHPPVTVASMSALSSPYSSPSHPHPHPPETLNLNASTTESVSLLNAVNRNAQLLSELEGSLRRSLEFEVEREEEKEKEKKESLMYTESPWVQSAVPQFMKKGQNVSMNSRDANHHHQQYAQHISGEGKAKATTRGILDEFSPQITTPVPTPDSDSDTRVSPSVSDELHERQNQNEPQPENHHSSLFTTAVSSPPPPQPTTVTHSVDQGQRFVQLKAADTQPTKRKSARHSPLYTISFDMNTVGRSAPDESSTSTQLKQADTSASASVNVHAKAKAKAKSPSQFPSANLNRSGVWRSASANVNTSPSVSVSPFSGNDEPLASAYARRRKKVGKRTLKLHPVSHSHSHSHSPHNMTMTMNTSELMGLGESVRDSAVSVARGDGTNALLEERRRLAATRRELRRVKTMLAASERQIK